jgi:hypothetical protein
MLEGYQDPKTPKGTKQDWPGRNGFFHLDYPHGSKSAGEVIGKSIYWMRNTRQADAKRIAADEEPVGPIWSYDVHGNPVYIHRDLILYIRKYIRAVPLAGSGDTPETPENTENTEDHPPAAA